MTLLKEEGMLIAGPAGNLEAIWQPSSAKGGKAVVICHPHPLYGGAMGNKVVTTLARAWREMGYGVLRFNFRGVGKSEGQHDYGKGEQDDLLAALNWLETTQSPKAYDLAGFSFGAWVAAATAERLPVERSSERLLLVAPPVHYEGFMSLHPSLPTLVLLGDDDEVVDPEAVKQWVATRQIRPVLQCFPGAGHFFHGQLIQLKESVMTQLSMLA